MTGIILRYRSVYFEGIYPRRLPMLAKEPQYWDSDEQNPGNQLPYIDS